MTPGAAAPGRGRRTRIPSAFETQATRALKVELGEPTVRTQRGSTLQVWEVDPEGDGIVCARLSSEDLDKGETAMGQVHGLRDLAERLDLRVRYIIVALRTSGVPDMDDRADFEFLRDRIARGGIAWVGYRHPDRVARHTYPAEAFYRYLEQAGIDLYLTSFGRKVDWVADRLSLLMHSVVSEQERNQIVNRLTDGRIRRWLEEGRGDPASRPFGFRRDDQRFLEVDPETWPIVEAIHHGYAPSTQEGRGGLRRLVDHALEMGSNLKSPERIRKILRDPMYVTGEWGANFKGTWYPGRTVELPRPIPRDVFERNQDILIAHRGPNTRHPIGTFLLNRIPLIHAPCETATVNGRPVLLRGRVHHDHSAYYHEPRCPDRCRGWSVPAADLEAAVVDQLLNLARSPQLQKEWAERARPGADAAAEDPAPQLAALRGRIDQLGRQRAEVKRRWIDDVACGNTRIDFLAEALEAIDGETSSLTKRADFLERLAAETRKARIPQDGLVEAMAELFRSDAPREPDLLRRRTAFVAAVLSRVIVHDTDDGFAVELEGPLVSPNAPFEPLNPAMGVDGCAVHELSTNDLVEGQFVRVPAWRSPVVPVVLPIGSRPGDTRKASPSQAFELAKEAILFVHAHAPDGPLFGRDGLYAEVVRFRPQYPPITVLPGVLARHGTSAVAFLREALGEEAISRGRLKGSKSYEDIVTALEMATDRGLVPGPGIQARYLAIRERERFLPSWEVLRIWAAPNGMTAAELIENAYAQRKGIPSAPREANGAPVAATAGEPQVVPAQAARRQGLTVEAFCAAIRDASQRHPTGPLFGGGQVSRSRWSPVALDHGIAVCPVETARQLRELDTTADELIRETLGDVEAVVSGRVPVASRDDVIAVLRAAIGDGFEFAAGWTLRAEDFGRTRSYPFTAKLIRRWANRHCGGERTRSLVSAARRAELDRPRKPDPLSPT